MERAATGLRKIVADALSQAPPEEAAVLAWPLVCGTAVAEKTSALELVEGVLRVQVPDAGWRKQLQGFTPHYLDAVNRIANGKVERIEFVVAGEARKDPQRAPGRP
ncbi:MAG TPA: DUF721 domain-containing protein [Terriglobales bacterium]|nr:DUF721 domain-containing protein [Terriglobales bacterium]